MIYFDNAATTVPDPEVRDVMHNILCDFYGNPSSVHEAGRQSRVLIEDARIAVASHIRALPSEVFFTSCGTEAINMAIFGTVKDLNLGRIIISPVEHHAVLHAAQAASEYFHCSVVFVKTDSRGVPDRDHLRNLLSSGQRSLVALMHANNETGAMLPVKDIATICHENDALFLSDTVQTIGKYEINTAHIPFDFISCSAHKFHGPKGIGFLYISGRNKIKPWIFGGGQERNMRSGTENIYGIAGLAKAMEVAYRDLYANQKHITQLKSYMAEQIVNFFPQAVFNADSNETGLYNVLSVSFPTLYKTDMLLQRLDMEGIAVSGGSACASGAVSASHVLQHLGVDPSFSTVRFSFSKYNSTGEVDYCIKILKKLLF